MTAAAIATKPRRARSSLEVVPSSNGFGADILGFDFESLDDIPCSREDPKILGRDDAEIV